MSETTEQTGRTAELSELLRLRTPRGGWDRKTLKALGVPWPPPKGWLRDLVGKLLPEAAACLLSSLKEQNRPKDDGVIWERAYRVKGRGSGWVITGPGLDEDEKEVFRDAAEKQAHCLNVAYNAGRRAARLGRK